MEKATRTLILVLGLPYSGRRAWALGMGFPVVDRSSVCRALLDGKRDTIACLPRVRSMMIDMAWSLFATGHETVCLIDDALYCSRAERATWGALGTLQPDPEMAFQTVVFRLSAAPDRCVEKAAAAGVTNAHALIEDRRGRIEAVGDDEEVFREIDHGITS